MGKTADLAMIQKTVIDALHKEGKSQRGITERGAVHRVLYQSIFNAKLTGRTNLGRKSCTSNRDDLKLVSHDLGCHVICWCWSTVFSGMLPSADKLYGDADLIFQ